MRDAFPVLTRRPGWTYLDSAATSLLHVDVLAAIDEALVLGGSAGRASHAGAIAATDALESARASVAEHLGASADTIVFVASATAGLNLVARGWGADHLLPGDLILVSELEHHSNLLPWRAIARETGAQLRVVPCDDRGDLDRDRIQEMLEDQPRLLAITHVSNVTGAHLPIAEISRQVRATAPDCTIVVDGTQAIPHLSIDIPSLDVDFYAFSGHKAYGPLGAGVVWARPDRWAQTRPALWGGGMVAEVRERDEVLTAPPWRFEGGTPNHVAIAGLAAGLQLCGPSAPLAPSAARELAEIDGVRVLGDPRERVGIVSWLHEGIHPHDAASLYEERGIALRAGHLCARPYLARLGAESAVRASFGPHNTPADLRTLVEAAAWVQQREASR